MPKSKVALAALALTLLLGFNIQLSSPSQVMANSDEARWSAVNIPTQGVAGNWVLATGSDVRCLTRAADSTLYCYANPSDTSYTLFKSADGYAWLHTGRVKDAIIDITAASDDAGVLYYATASTVYRSTDAGASFAFKPRWGGEQQYLNH
jgi:hypothetical protein